MHTKRNTNAGFTLLEAVVAFGIFTLLLVTTLGFYSTFIGTQRRDIAEQQMLEEVRLALDVLSTETRTAYGSTFFAADSAGKGVTFHNQNGTCVHYRFRDNTLERAETESSDEFCLGGSFNAASYAQLLDSRITLANGRFLIRRAPVAGNRLESQGFITISFSAHSDKYKLAPIDVQTSISSRQVIPYATQN